MNKENLRGIIDGLNTKLKIDLENGLEELTKSDFYSDEFKKNVEEILNPLKESLNDEYQYNKDRFNARAGVG
jgi:hypothetical protein